MTSPLLSILVPVLNEAGNIESFLDQAFQSIEEPFEILILFDDVNDNTLPAVASYLEKHPRRQDCIRTVPNIVYRGASGALRTGFLEARGRHVLVAMADLCDDLTQVESMRAFMKEGYSIVCPSRYCEGGEQRLKSIRAFVPRIVGRALRWFTGFPSSDATNSYRLYSKDLLDSLNLTSTHSFSVTLEITAKAHCLGYRIKEIPTVWNARQVGQSKFPFLASLVSYLPWFFLALTRNRLFSLPHSWRKAFAAGLNAPQHSTTLPPQ